MTKHITPTLLALAALATLAACSSDGCLDNTRSIPLAGFFDAEGNAVSVSNVTLRGIGAPGDSVLASNETLGTFSLPLRSTTGTTQWEFTFGPSAVTDTVTFAYDALPVFVSADCGAMFNYKINSVSCTTHAIDSVAVTVDVVDNQDHGTIVKIYLPS